MSSDPAPYIKAISQDNGIILLYHSIAEAIPQALQGTLHNITPSIFKSHLQQLSPWFDFVSLEQFAQADEKRGLAAITFDDGYISVFDNALPILDSFNYPFTFFLNSVTFEKRLNWRDKVRYLIHHDLVDDFEQNYEFEVKEGRFYRYSKNPVNNSAELDIALDLFLDDHVVDIYNEYPYLTEQDLIADHDLISYGNHSHNHYVLSSLSDYQQRDEILATQIALNSHQNIELNKSFSAPFGGGNDVNAITRQILYDLHYRDLLMSRQRFQPNKTEHRKIQILERFMPRSDDIIAELAILEKH